MQPHEHLNLALGMVEAAMRRPPVDHIDATVGTEISREPDPLADRFTVERFHGGDVDVRGKDVCVMAIGSAVKISATTAIGIRDLDVTRQTAMEIRDALEVLIRETRRNTPE